MADIRSFLIVRHLRSEIVAGVLMRHKPEALETLLHYAHESRVAIEARTMVQARLEDDRVPFGWGIRAKLAVARERLRLVVDTA
jgi:hypothetical protein